MFQDPATSLSVPPPRYKYTSSSLSDDSEQGGSDDSDEEGAGLYSGYKPKSTTKRDGTNKEKVVFVVEWDDKELEDVRPKTIVVGMESIGKALTIITQRIAGIQKGQLISTSDSSSKTKSKALLDLYYAQKENTVYAVEANHIGMKKSWNVAQGLMDLLGGEGSLIFLQPYIPQTYISSSSSSSTQDPPIRYLSTSPSPSSLTTSGFRFDDERAVEEWESPNYVIGLGAAGLSLITQSPKPTKTIGSIFLLPQPLHPSLLISSLTTSLSSSSSITTPDELKRTIQSNVQEIERALSSTKSGERRKRRDEDGAGMYI